MKATIEYSGIQLHIPEHTRSAFQVCSQQSEVQK